MFYKTCFLGFLISRRGRKVRNAIFILDSHVSRKAPRVLVISKMGEVENVGLAIGSFLVVVLVISICSVDNYW